MNRWKYTINGLDNVYHFSTWPIYKDWTTILQKGNTKNIDSFHNTFLMNVNKQLEIESIIKNYEKKYTFYDTAWRTFYTLDYDPYKKIIQHSARWLISEGEPVDSLVWLSKRNDLDEKQLLYGLYSLISRGKLNEAKLILYLFPTLPYNSSDVNLFSIALLSKDIPLIHELWKRGALNMETKKCCDRYVEKGMLRGEVLDWYIMHRHGSYLNNPEVLT